MRNCGSQTLKFRNHSFATFFSPQFRNQFGCPQYCGIAEVRTKIADAHLCLFHVLILYISANCFFQIVLQCTSEMRNCEISKDMSSLLFGLAVFCLFEARVPEFDTQPLPLSPPPTAVDCTVYTVRRTLRQFWDSSF